MFLCAGIGASRGDEELSSFSVDHVVFDTVEASAKYANYLSRQDDEMARWRKSGHVVIPLDVQYSHEVFPSMSSEEIEQLTRHKPRTMHEASQLQGLTPHALVYLHNYITRGRYMKAKWEAKQLVGAATGSGDGAGEGGSVGEQGDSGIGIGGYESEGVNSYVNLVIVN